MAAINEDDVVVETESETDFDHTLTTDEASGNNLVFPCLLLLLLVVGARQTPVWDGDESAA